MFKNTLKINKILIIILIIIIIINLSNYEYFDNDTFNKTDLEKYDNEINKNLEILNNLFKKVKSNIQGVQNSKNQKVSLISKTTNKKYAQKGSVSGFVKNAGLS